MAYIRAGPAEPCCAQANQGERPLNAGGLSVWGERRRGWASTEGFATVLAYVAIDISRGVQILANDPAAWRFRCLFGPHM